MPKRAQYLLSWSAETGQYTLREQRGEVLLSFQEGAEAWFDWLATQHSFAFEGKYGHLNLLREARARGSEYWYAYQSQQRRTKKKYAGRTIDLSCVHLESLAQAFQEMVPEPSDKDLQPVPQMSQHPGPLLEPKLQSPRVPSSLVTRDRLFRLMNAGLERKLTLICAPAGFGKTTLVSQWLRAERRTSLPLTAWISLDSGDNDLMRFWRYVITAFQRLYTDSSLSLLLAELPRGFEPPSLDTILTHLLNELARSKCTCIVILEDYHVITETHIHKSFIYFLNHLPMGLHIVMLTRTEPPFPLALWRVHGDLSEISLSDLRFTYEESAQFFRHVSADIPHLSTKSLHHINERVEGWAAGLRLLALTLRNNTSEQNIDLALADFAGDQRALQEFFVTEVLDAQAETVQHFLLSTSILDRLTGDLCDDVVGNHESAQVLANAERAGLFVELLSGVGAWYRYHALFAEAMRAVAFQRLGNEAIHDLYLRASQWYEHQHLLPEAVEAAFQAKAIERAAILIETLLEPMTNFMLSVEVLQRGLEFHTLRCWLEQLPKPLLHARPLLSFCFAVTVTFIYFIEQSVPPLAVISQFKRTLQLAEEGWRREDNRPRLGQLFAFRALILRQPGIMREAMSYAHQALSYLTPEAIEGRMMSLWLVGMGEFQEGRFDRAREAFNEVRAFYTSWGNHGITRAITVWFGLLDYAQGELHRSYASFQTLLSVAREAADIDDTCDALLGLAQIAYEWNKLGEAQSLAQEAFVLTAQLANFDLQMQATLILVRIDTANGDVAEAQRRCDVLLAALPASWPQWARLMREIHLAQARLALTQRDDVALARWWKHRVLCAELPSLLNDQETLVWARWQIDSDHIEAALTKLADLLCDAQAGQRFNTVLEAQLLMALAHAARKQLSSAQKHLINVIERAYEANYTRLFLDEGEPLAALLHTIVPMIHERPHQIALQRVVRTMTSLTSNDPLLANLLSTQEQEVLSLLATGLSNPEIAQRRVVTVNTIKSQIQSIYRKLNVTNRVEASKAAHMRNLL